MKINAALTISYPNGGHVRIAIRDEASRTMFVELDISHEEFSRALGSLVGRPATAEVRGLETIGKVVQYEEFTIDFDRELPSKYDDYEGAEDMLVAAATAQGYGGDGWLISAYSALNSQRGNGRRPDGSRWYRMQRKRYVEPEPQA